MPELERGLEFGLSLEPRADRIELNQELTLAAERLGLTWIGIQDHPYQRRYLDTSTLLTWLAAKTTAIRFFADVANLPLRPPAMLAKATASLDLLSGGRFELGLGSGAFPEAVAAMGGPKRSGGEAVDALEEAIAVIRAAWSEERSVRVDGTHYGLHGYKPGPRAAHDIGIWLGAYRPRMLEVTGRLADGWVPSYGRMADDDLLSALARVEAAALKAGRDPATIRRVLNVGGRIQAERTGRLEGPPGHWAENLTRLAEGGFDTFVFWPEFEADGGPLGQLERFATEVVPEVMA
jgi:alkanesulfonate monooxygenase SsuD/methylene tetrahydromethanopterin reductase-like flavin-dependent oxidoreductase (luciferase family)